MNHPVNDRLQKRAELQAEHSTKCRHHITEFEIRHDPGHDQNRRRPDHICFAHIFLCILRQKIQRMVDRAIHMCCQSDRQYQTDTKPGSKRSGISCDHNTASLNHRTG